MSARLRDGRRVSTIGGRRSGDRVGNRLTGGPCALGRVDACERVSRRDRSRVNRIRRPTLDGSSRRERPDCAPRPDTSARGPDRLVDLPSGDMVPRTSLPGQARVFRCLLTSLTRLQCPGGATDAETVPVLRALSLPLPNKMPCALLRSDIIERCGGSRPLPNKMPCALLRSDIVERCGGSRPLPSKMPCALLRSDIVERCGGLGARRSLRRRCR